MGNKLLFILVCSVACGFSFEAVAQAPALGILSDFSLFTSSGNVSNMGESIVTGDIGTNDGSISGFGNINGNIHDSDDDAGQADVALFVVYNQLNLANSTNTIGTTMGNGQTLTSGVYSITGGASINDTLFLDAQNNPNATFIFKIDGSLAVHADAKVMLKNGAEACNVFWKVEGGVNLSAGTRMTGTIVANDASIIIAAADSLDGRAFTTGGSITVTEARIQAPYGCGAPQDGPNAPELGAAACFALFASDGAVSNSGTTMVTGDVGSNSSPTVGFNSNDVDGTVHLFPDGSTAQAASDLEDADNYLTGMSYDIELAYPADFGNGLVLTPHAYLLNSDATLTDTVYFDAMENTNAVFIIKVNGNFSTTMNSNIMLMNGAQSRNIYWKIDGIADIAEYSWFRGTIVANSAQLGDSVRLFGRALVTESSLTVSSMDANAPVPGSCAFLGIPDPENGENLIVYPNPFSTTVTVTLTDESLINRCELFVYDLLGEEQLENHITGIETILDLEDFPSGVYFYKLIENNVILQTGKLIAK